jgi:hypothetical protein
LEVVAGAVVDVPGRTLLLLGTTEDGVEPTVVREPAVLMCAAITKETAVTSAATVVPQNQIHADRWG